MIRELLTVCLILAGTCRADNIYSNFGAGNTFDPTTGVVISSNTGDQRPSFAFTPANGESLTEIDFVTSIGSIGDANQVTVTLSDDAAGVPGNTLASMTFTGLMGIEGSTVNPPSIIQWLLQSPQAVGADLQYWVTFDAPSPGVSSGIPM